MSQNMSSPVLANKVAQVRPQAHVCHRRLMVTPLFYGEPLEEDEALAIENLLADGFKESSEFR